MPSAPLSPTRVRDCPVGDRDSKEGGGELGNLKIDFLIMAFFTNLSRTYAKDKLSKCAPMVLLVCCYLYRKRSNIINVNAEA